MKRTTRRWCCASTCSNPPHRPAAIATEPLPLMNTDPHLHGSSTLCIHAGTHLEKATGGACSPVFSSSAYAFPNPANENI